MLNLRSYYSAEDLGVVSVVEGPSEVDEPASRDVKCH